MSARGHVCPPVTNLVPCCPFLANSVRRTSALRSRAPGRELPVPLVSSLPPSPLLLAPIAPLPPTCCPPGQPPCPQADPLHASPWSPSERLPCVPAQKPCASRAVGAHCVHPARPCGDVHKADTRGHITRKSGHNGHVFFDTAVYAAYAIYALYGRVSALAVISGRRGVIQ